jgi:hypothetical protein
MELVHVSPCGSGVMARLLLDALLAADQTELNLRIDQVGQAPLQGDNAVETDRVDILKALAIRMRSASFMSDDRSAANPKIGSWIELLNHFSKPPERLAGDPGRQRDSRSQTPAISRQRPFLL